MRPNPRSFAERLSASWRNRALSVKALSFALIGVVNTLVDYCIFLAARAALARSPSAQGLFDSVSASCRCANTTTVALIAANMISWTIAVSGSYVLNSSITFAAESGRKLRWRSYLIFLASGIVGWFANTATLVFAAQVLQFPVWVAKAIAILASFVVNFTLSHFIVFRVRHQPAVDARDDV
ncbi:MAG: GtrA family protein [Xanthobacteraceae bacterium]